MKTKIKIDVHARHNIIESIAKFVGAANEGQIHIKDTQEIRGAILYMKSEYPSLYKDIHVRGDEGGTLIVVDGDKLLVTLRLIEILEFNHEK